MQNLTQRLADKSSQLQQANQNPLFSPEKPQPGSPATPRNRHMGAAASLQVHPMSYHVLCQQCIRRQHYI